MNTRHRTIFRLVIEKNPERTFTQQEVELLLGLSKPGKRVMKAYPPPEKKAIPAFQKDEDAEQFVDTADLSEYDLSGFKKVHFEFKSIEESTDGLPNDFDRPRLRSAINDLNAGKGTQHELVEKMTLDKAIETTFAQNSEVKKHYDEMEEEYKIKAQNIEAARHKGNKRRSPS
jgi:hypothetical protein